jgi:hypothetical protein
MACSGPTDSVTALMKAERSFFAAGIWSAHVELENDSFVITGPNAFFPTLRCAIEDEPTGDDGTVRHERDHATCVPGLASMFVTTLMLPCVALE